MVNPLQAGDYIPRGSGIVRLRGRAAQAADAAFRLQCRRGSFPFLPALGSRLWLLGREREADRPACARQFCAEALQGTGVELQSVAVRTLADAIVVEVGLCIGGEETTVEVSL